jgi:hypothetical protein
MNPRTAIRLVLTVALLTAPLAPLAVLDGGESGSEPIGGSASAVETLERLFRGGPPSQPDPVDTEVLVTVKLRQGGSLPATGLEVQRRFVRQGTHHVEGYVPLSSVRDLSTDPAVRAVRMRGGSDPQGRVAGGVGRIRADRLHRQGVTGENVTVGVIDGGFRMSDPELAGHVAAYRSFGTPGGTDHGTAVASVVADTAPDADLHLAAVGDSTSVAEYRDAVAWLRASGADIIVDAGSYFGHAGADTTALSAVATNASREVVFVTSAGNFGQRHWSGVHEPDDRRWLTFRPGAEGNPLAGGEVVEGRVRASLAWDPVDGSAATGGYELYLLRRGVGGQRVVASAAADAGESSAYIDAVVPRGRYYLAVEGEDADTPHRLELFATRDLTYRTPNGSLSAPASAPGVLAVGAYDHTATAVAPFSSRGPVGNRTGVDLVAPDAVAAPGTGASGGTSFAAPYVAGSAALLASAHPNASAAALRAALTAGARDIGPDGPDAVAGHGLLDAEAAATVATARFEGHDVGGTSGRLTDGTVTAVGSEGVGGSGPGGNATAVARG